MSSLPTSVAGNNSNTWIPATHVGDLDYVLDSWFWLGPALAFEGVWRVNQWMGMHSLSHSHPHSYFLCFLFQIKYKNKCNFLKMRNKCLLWPHKGLICIKRILFWAERETRQPTSLVLIPLKPFLGSLLMLKFMLFDGVKIQI